ncbi:MAG: DNA polymerase III subunit alpha, partial [Planctomycetia bacterium]
ARGKGIPCGARGSACGALVSYLLGFSDVDPLEFDLLFERFLDPNRAEAPDIDIDFCQVRREEVIQFIREKYGADNVAQIVTFNTMAARAAIKDVSRALEVPLPRVDQITKMIPKTLNITIAEALKQTPELKREYDTDPEIRRVMDIAMRVEGLNRNPGVHAAGVVIADKPLINYIPLQNTGDVVTTQWEMSILEKVGMLKVDFLGLRTLTMVQNALKILKKTRGVVIDLLDLPPGDRKTYELLQKGESKGVFQLESEGIRNLLIGMKPDRFQDLIATNALYRPGPLGGGMVDTYKNVKHGREQAQYAHPVMREVLEETYGVMVYQEQVMRILNRLGGIPLADAYKCIKAISKKNMEVIAKNRAQFVQGAVAQGMDAAAAEDVFQKIEFFAGYGFNKSHSTAYALLAYQTAYLKAHHPAEFMAALMSSEVDKTALLVEHIDDCKRMGLTVLPPDVNESDVEFTVVDGRVRFGMTAVKGVGEKAVASIVAERQARGAYKSLFDFCERTDVAVVPKSCIEALIKTGAFDAFGFKRSQLAAALPTALQSGAMTRDARNSGQGLLFDAPDAEGDPAQAVVMPNL